MFRNAIPLFRISGIMLKVDASWILIAGLIVWSLTTQFFPAVLPEAGLAMHLSLGVVGAFGLFGSLVLHELAHSVVARRLGLKIRGITLFLFGGVAELGSEPRRPAHEFWIAIAGPLASLALALIFGFLGGLTTNLAMIWLLTYLAYVNGALAIFNLIPAYPMDGGRVLRAFLWHRSGSIHKATAQAARTGTVFGLLLIGYGLYSTFLGGGIGSFWLVLIGFFIYSSAKANHAAARHQMALGGRRVGDLMSAPAITVPPSLTLDRLVNEVMLPHKLSFIPVVEGDRLLGYIDGDSLRRVPKEGWPTTRVADIFLDVNAENTISPEIGAQDVMERMATSGRRKFLVTRRGRLVGVLSITDVAAFLSLKESLEP